MCKEITHAGGGTAHAGRGTTLAARGTTRVKGPHV